VTPADQGFDAIDLLRVEIDLWLVVQGRARRGRCTDGDRPAARAGAPTASPGLRRRRRGHGRIAWRRTSRRPRGGAARRWCGRAWGYIAMPMLADTCTISPVILNPAAQVRSIFQAAAAAARSVASPGSTANSSPPSRAIVSVSRGVAIRRLPTCLSRPGRSGNLDGSVLRDQQSASYGSLASSGHRQANSSIGTNERMLESTPAGHRHQRADL
jgi:hypothetical protein